MMKTLLLVVAASLQLCTAYKILVYSPGFSNSNLMFNGRIADPLINAARILTVDVDLKEKWAKAFEKLYDVAFKGTPVSVFDFVDFQKLSVETCHAQLKRKDVMDVLRAEKFDLAISETMEFCSFGLFHHLNIPSNIVVSPGPLMDFMADAFGFPAAASHVPS
uniref:glucuronosyltransferase n=1 Tax=Plectus sambesii TaxID=2011161 RepID=A0A914WEE8_9BILA